MIILKRALFILAILQIILSFSLFAQDIDTTDSSQEKFVESVEWAWGAGKDFSPFLEATYGYGSPQHMLFTLEFQNIGLAELKLGYSRIDPYKGLVSDLDERYLFGSQVSTDLNYLDNILEGVETKMKRFGFGNRLGFGYDVGIMALLFYHQAAFVWTQVQSDTTQITNQEDIDILNRYEGTYRFGISMEGGIKFDLLKSLAATASYEFAVIYPRHIFWEWFASYTIMYTGIATVSVFSEDIVNSSPFFGPLFYFILKNGISYAFYQGMKDKMNWPFTSETPLTLETIKIGVSITF
jgi:hypothetical protein